MFNKKIKISKNLGIFLIFVLFATIIWFLNTLNKEYNTDIKLPVIYYNMPQDKVNISNLPEEFTVSIKAYGYDILKYQLKKNFIPTKLDIGSYKFNPLLKNDTNKYYLLSNELINQVENEFNGKMKVEYIKPDTLYFNFTEFSTKKVPVIVNADIIPKSQYIFKGDIEIEPDSVTIKGPLAIIDTIQSVKTNFFELKALSENTIYKAPISEIEYTEISPSSVDLYVNIEEYTEVRFKIPIEKENVADSVYLHLFPNYVNIVCKVGLSNYDNLKASDFKVIVDYYSIFEKEGGKLYTQLISYPKAVYNFYYTPEFVDYIIEKK